MATEGMVTSPHYLASAAGLDVLRSGGSAVDACIAMSATLCVVYPHMSGLGGDLFVQVWQPGDMAPNALNASGRSGERATIEAYRSKGRETIESRGPLAANTVPGVVDGWSLMHERYGRLDWISLFVDARRYADEGFPITQRLCDYIHLKRDEIEPYEATRSVFLKTGVAPRAGSLFRQADLARSLGLVAEQGREAFYGGELAERLVTGLQAAGGLLTLDDFASHASDWVDPLQTTYRGYDVTQLPPNTQGIAMLLILNLIEPEDVAGMGDLSADWIHLIVEATKVAFADRDRWVTDAEAIDVPYERLLAKSYASERRQMIDPAAAHGDDAIEPGIDTSIASGGQPRQPVGVGASAAPGRGDGDTVYLTAVDRDGMVCSLIQSIYHEFGSAFMPEGTGIILQNRGSFFSLDPDHPNALAPRKRTFHTIIPAMALKDGRVALSFGTMGGEGQPQSQVAVLSRILDFGADVQEAIEAPRWLFGRTWGQESRTLKLEGRVPDAVAGELKRRGHAIEMTEDWSQTLGHAQAIRIDHDTGVLHGGADPRGDGVALGY